MVLWRRENIPAYHLTSVVDDARMGVNLVIRGADLLESTELQRSLSKAFPGDPLGKVSFVHHRLLTTEDGAKLSKSRQDGDLMMRLRRQASPQEIWQELGERMGLSFPLSSVRDLQSVSLSEFSV
jgi:glutamyl-tRNA synthetase